MTLLLSTDTDSGTVSVFNYSVDKISPLKVIEVGNGPRGAVRFSSNGFGYVTNHAGNTISEIDMNSLEEIGKIEVGIAPIGMQILHEKFAIVSNSGDDDISIVDLEKRVEVARIPVGREPRHPDVSPNGHFAYVPLSRDDAVSKIDLRLISERGPKGLKEIRRIDVGTGTRPYSCAVAPSGKSVVVANNQRSYITIIDTETDEVVHNVDVGSKGARGTAFNNDGELALVTIEDVDEIIAIDLNSGEIVDRYHTGPGPRGIFYDARSNRAGSASFARAAKAGRENTVSVMSFGAQPLIAARRASRPDVVDIQVGYGPCSVVLYDAN